MHSPERLPSDWRTTSSPFRVAPHFTATFRSCVLTLALLLSGPVLAAGFTCVQPVSPNAASIEKKSTLDELEEVVVNGSKSTSRTKDLRAWLKLLEGQFSYEGYVDLCGNGNAADQRPVTGKADCAGLYTRSRNNVFDELPNNLNCVVNVRWPRVLGENGIPVTGGESILSPAVAFYGVVPDLPGIQFMQIDNQGMTTHVRGKLTGDTLTTTESCRLPGFCQKVTRITARPDSNEIVTLIDFQVDSRRVLRHAFLLHRVSNIPTSNNRWIDPDPERPRYRAQTNDVDLELLGER